MDYSDLKLALADRSLIAEQSFQLLQNIADFVNQRETHNQGRDLVIRALAVQGQFSDAEQQILISLVRSVGLFPYMTPSLQKTDLEDYLAYELHRADHMSGDLVFHSLQAKIFHQLMSGSNVVLSASTSVGKSLVIDALVASDQYKKIVVVVPTLALIDETRKRLLERFQDKCAIITHPTQVEHPDIINIYVLTQERVLQRDDLGDATLCIIDEFYKVSLDGKKPSDRAVDLNLAFHKLAKNGSQFYLLGPNVQAIKGLEKYEFHFIPSEFSTVAVDITNFDLPTRGESRSEKLLELCKTIDGPSIIYCQSPQSATNVANYLVKNADFPVSEYTSSAVSWMADNYHPQWSVAEALERGIGLHHGGVPRALQQYFIRLFNEKKIKHLVCTSTIIEGVNTVAKNVIIYDRRKNKGVLDHFTYKNIVGRAGRMQEYFIGQVYVLESAPPDESFSVEFPIGEQNPDTPMSLLLDLEQEYLTSPSKERLKSAYDNSTLSPETLRANRHTLIHAQEEIASRIRNDLVQYEDVLVWNSIPTAPQLHAVCDLIYSHLEEDLLRDYGIFSSRQLAWHLNTLRIEKSLSKYIKALIESKHEDQTASQAIEKGLKFIRNVVCHRFPRDLMAIDAIQREIFSRKGVKSGDYALFAELTENLFMPAALFALDEYGVPVQTAQTLSNFLTPADTLDTVLSRLVRLQFNDINLSEFEIDVLADVCGNIFLTTEAG